VSPILEVSSAVLTHPGRKRPHNEDFVAYYEPDSYEEWGQKGCLYIVADGVGGASKGEKASQFAAQDVLYRFDNDHDPDLGARLRRALRAAGNAIYDHAERSGSFQRMATTLVAAAVREDKLTVANVGDSRAYLIRGGQVHQITTDHTIAGEMLRHGDITEEEAQHVKGKNRITRSIGGERDVRVDIFPNIPLQPGDKILLCSDGLARYTLAADILHLTKAGTPAEVVQRSIAFANARGGVDNISVALIAIGDIAQPGTVPSQAGAVPVEVNLEDVTTQPSVQMPPSGFRPTPLQWALLAVTFVVAAGVIGIGFSRLFGKGSKEDAAATETAAAAIIIATDAGTETAPGESDAGITPLPSETPAETDAGQPGADTPPDTAPDTPPDTAPDTPPDEGQPQPSIGCIYTVQEEEGLLNILLGFGLEGSQALNLSNQVIDLITGELLEDPNKIEPNQELILPFITDETTCIAGGGEWKPLPPRETDTDL